MGKSVVFLDRDGVINSLVFDPERQAFDSPYHIDHVRLMPHAGEGMAALNQLGLPIIVVSNQPGIGKLKCTQRDIEAITLQIQRCLTPHGARWDHLYYCLHHPNAVLRDYRQECDCRKPKPGLLTHAAMLHDIDLTRSYMVGDDLVDILAGKSAGCTTILLGRLHCVMCKYWHTIGARPDHLVGNLLGAAELIAKLEGERNGIAT